MTTIRILTHEDAAAFQGIRLRGLLECPSAFSSSHAEEVNTPLETIAQRMTPRPDGVIFGSFAGPGLVGVVGVQREARSKLAHKAFIWGMYVEQAHRRCGIGRKLLQAALEHAATELGVLSVNLGVNADNASAIGLYESIGFRTYGTERGFLQVDGVLHDEHLMAWTRASVA